MLSVCELHKIIFTGVSLSEPHHIKSKMKSVILLARFVIPYMAERHLGANQKYIKLEWCIKC